MFLKDNYCNIRFPESFIALYPLQPYRRQHVPRLLENNLIFAQDFGFLGGCLCWVLKWEGRVLWVPLCCQCMTVTADGAVQNVQTHTMSCECGDSMKDYKRWKITSFSTERCQPLTGNPGLTFPPFWNQFFCQRKMCQYSAGKTGFLPHCTATNTQSMQVIKTQVFVMAGFVLIAVELNWECFLNVVCKRHFSKSCH